jgi:hypothetical protein
VRDGREAGVEIALDLAINASADHPWLTSTPSGSSAARTGR